MGAVAFLMVPVLVIVGFFAFLLLLTGSGSAAAGCGTGTTTASTVDVSKVFQQLDMPGTYVLFAVPRGQNVSKFVGTPLVLKGMGALGQHTDELLSEMGASTQDIAQLRAAGAVR